MKILLTAINSKYIHTNISLRYLEKMTADLPVETLRREFTVNEQKDRILEEIMKTEADVIAFSVYIWNFALITELSTMIRQVNENIKILYGGPEVSYDSRKHLEIMAGDYIIRGEGELSYGELVGSLLYGKDLSLVKGLTYRNDEGEISENPDREKMDISLVPYPYHSDEALEGKIAYLEASRGCPYACSYCLSSSERDLRFMPAEAVNDRIDKVLKTGTTLVKFIDRTFNIHPEAEEIWTHIISLNTSAVFHFEVAPDLVSERHLDLLCTCPPGRIQFEAGIQSTRKEVLLSISRHMGYEALLPKLRALLSLKHIHSHLDLIAGLPFDSKDSFHKSFNDVFLLKPDVLQLGFLKVIKGTPMARDAEKYGIIYSPYPPYEVLKTKWIDYDALRSLHQTEEALERYHNSGRFKKTLGWLLEEEKDPFTFFEALGAFMKEKSEDKSVGAREQYEILFHFALKKLKEKAQHGDRETQENNRLLLNELLKHDWLSGNKKQYVPPFIERIGLGGEGRRNLVKGQGRRYHVEMYAFDMPAFFRDGILKKENTPLYYDEETGAVLATLNSIIK